MFSCLQFVQFFLGYNMNPVLFENVDCPVVILYPENHKRLPFFTGDKSIGVFKIDLVVPKNLYDLI